VDLGGFGAEDNMDWIIQSKDRSISEIKYYTTEDVFLVALRDLFGAPKQQFISATLPDGTVLDEATAKGLTIGVSPIGQTPLG
jgi:hypothetical protein